MSIKHEPMVVDCTVIVCDECGTKGPHAAYDNAEDVIDEAERLNWHVDPDAQRDLCPTCTHASGKKK